MSNDEWNVQSKSIDSVLEFCKQQLTIAGVLIGLSITLNTNLVPKTATTSRTNLIVSWFLLFGSIISGLLSLGRASYVLSDMSKALNDRIDQLRVTGAAQIVFLIVGILFLIIAVLPHMGG